MQETDCFEGVRHHLALFSQNRSELFSVRSQANCQIAWRRPPGLSVGRVRGFAGERAFRMMGLGDEEGRDWVFVMV